MSAAFHVLGGDEALQPRIRDVFYLGRGLSRCLALDAGIVATPPADEWGS